MPNYVQNNITFSGDDAEIKKMLEAIKADEIGFGSIDFNKIIPIPESLIIESGSSSNKGIEMVKSYLENMPEELKNKEGTYEEIFDDLRNHSADISDEEDKKIWDIGVKAAYNLYKYDVPTWYEWCCKNWGTKWNACSCSEANENSKTISFQTAWDTPLPVMEKLSKMFPAIEIQTEYADENIGENCGQYTFKGGELKSMWQPTDEETNKNALEFAAKVWDTELDSCSLHINKTMTAYIPTWNNEFELVELFGKPALFTNENLSADKVPHGLNFYHIRSGDGEQFGALEPPNVQVNNSGTIITNETIDFGENGYIEFNDENSINLIGGDNISIDDYVTENFSMDISDGEEQTGGMQM